MTDRSRMNHKGHEDHARRSRRNFGLCDLGGQNFCVQENGRRCGRPFPVKRWSQSYRLPPVLFAIHAPPGRDRLVVPPWAETWPLEAFIWRRIKPNATVISR